MNAEKESISGRPDERTADATSVPALIKRAAQLEPNLGQVQPPHYPPSPGAPGQQPTEATVGNGHGLVGPSMVGDMTGGVSPVLAQNQGALALAGAKGVEHLAGGIKDGGALDTAGKAVQKRPRSDSGKDERDVQGAKKAREDKDDEMDRDEDKAALSQKRCPHNRAKATCIECTGCPHGKRRQNCKECNAGSRQWCVHGKRRHDCGECSGCPHGKIKRSCKECNGSGICVHGKLKRSCKECSTDMCEHKRRRYYCRECGGAGSCAHNNRRWRCRECNALYTCEHGKVKSNCLECEMLKAPQTSSVGEAAKAFEKKSADPDVPPPPPPDDMTAQQSESPPNVGVQSQKPGGASAVAVVAAGAGGSAAALASLEKESLAALQLAAPLLMTSDSPLDSTNATAAAASAADVVQVQATARAQDDAALRVCVHNKWKIYCADCGGSGLCPHNKRKGTCKTCGGAQFCEHKRLRRQCRICRPDLKSPKISLCPHGKRKARCRECGGSQFCEHDKNKDWCKICGGRRLCQHQRQKHQCRECCALNICPHKRPEQCVGKSGKERGRPRIHPEKPKVPGEKRRGRPPKLRQGVVTKDGTSGMDVAEARAGSVGFRDDNKSEAASLSNSVPAPPPPPPPDTITQVGSAATSMIGTGAAGVDEVLSSSTGGLKKDPPKDKVHRASKKIKKATEGEDETAEPGTGGHDGDAYVLLHALSAQAVKAKEDQSKEAEAAAKEKRPPEPPERTWRAKPVSTMGSKSVQSSTAPDEPSDVHFPLAESDKSAEMVKEKLPKAPPRGLKNK